MVHDFETELPEDRKQGKKIAAKEDETREFRGVWLQTAWQERYQKMSSDECQKYLAALIDTLSNIGFNAVIFQIRPEGDAFYESNYEPWSRFLTGVQGKAPSPKWDPMAFLIEQCHKHNMEFHAWINPYRMAMSKAMKFDYYHIYNKHPEWFVEYDDRLYLNPGLPDCRTFIRTVVKDIVSRYDVDAIHMDDYFYPYPVKGKKFNDEVAFRKYASKLGINTKEKDALGNFRRRNVDILIKYLHKDIKKLKPEVKFGVSPFGIYRNKGSWDGGSETKGTQCYDDLYADILFWAESGWIDYVIPQIYWEIGHPLADYSVLVKWWDANTPKNCALYIGQSIERSKNTLGQKLDVAAQAKTVHGNCFWYGYQVEDNYLGVRDFLYDYWK